MAELNITDLRTINDLLATLLDETRVSNATSLRLERSFDRLDRTLRHEIEGLRAEMQGVRDEMHEMRSELQAMHRLYQRTETRIRQLETPTGEG